MRKYLLTIFLSSPQLAAKEQQSSNVSVLMRWLCKLVVNKLPLIHWKSTDKSIESSSRPTRSADASPVKRKSPLKGDLVKQSSQIRQPESNKSPLTKPADQPDVVPMVHLVLPVRQRCHSTTDCF